MRSNDTDYMTISIIEVKTITTETVLTEGVDYSALNYQELTILTDQSEGVYVNYRYTVGQ